MAFNFFDTYYGYVIGFKIRGSIGNKYTYQVTKNVQCKHRYCRPPDPTSPAQLRQQDLMRLAMFAWHALPAAAKTNLPDYRRGSSIMSGFNYFLSNYINKYK
jgi:hypothetical protein